MSLASTIYWFYRDNCCYLAPISQIEARLNDLDFVNDLLNDTFNTATRCQRDIAKLGDPYDFEGFEYTVYDDLVELHNRAVELYNTLVNRVPNII